MQRQIIKKKKKKVELGVNTVDKKMVWHENCVWGGDVGVNYTGDFAH